MAILVFATIGLLGAQPTAEAAVVPSHISADVVGEVEQTTTPCTIAGWEDPITHTADPDNFPDTTAGLKAIFSDTVITGFFHLETNLLGFLGEVETLPDSPIEACLTNIPGTPADPKLFNYGKILPGGLFRSLVSGVNPLPETAVATPFTCVYGEVLGGLFLTGGTEATALIDIAFTVVPAADLGVPCPTPHPATSVTVTVLAQLSVVPCDQVPPPGCVVEDASLVAGVVELLPTTLL